MSSERSGLIYRCIGDIGRIVARVPGIVSFVCTFWAQWERRRTNQLSTMQTMRWFSNNPDPCEGGLMA